MSRKERPMERAYMPLYTGRYLRKTRRLKAVHHGAYLMILMALWEEGGSLPHDEDELRELACCDRRTWPGVWEKIRPFFTIHDGRVTQHTAAELLEDFDTKRQSHVAGGKRSGAKHAEKMRKIKERDRAKLEDSLSSKAKGFASPSYEGERQSLSAESVKLFAEILMVPHLVRTCRTTSLAEVRQGLLAFEGGVFYVSGECADAEDWRRICEQVERWHFRIELSEQRVLRFPEGGRR